MGLLTNPGWVVIHDTSSVIIGYAPITAGTNRNVTVALDRNAVKVEVLHAMLHKDDIVIGTFEAPGPDVNFIGDRNVLITNLEKEGMKLDILDENEEPLSPDMDNSSLSTIERI